MRNLIKATCVWVMIACWSMSLASIFVITYMRQIRDFQVKSMEDVREELFKPFKK